jgi:ribose 5-phosphate isomerase A
MSEQTDLKRKAALYALDKFVQPNMQIGLGSGSTAEIFVAELGKRVAAGQYGEILTVATSAKVEELGRSVKLKVVPLDAVEYLDVTIDGADEIEPGFGLIKGGGGALLREKLVAAASRVEVIIADGSKLSVRLGEKWAVPVEVIPFGWEHTARRLAALGCEPVLRATKAETFMTDNRNYILDCRFSPLANPAETAALLKGIVGVVEHGLFIEIAKHIVIADKDKGVYELEKSSQGAEPRP